MLLCFVVHTAGQKQKDIHLLSLLQSAISNNNIIHLFFLVVLLSRNSEHKNNKRWDDVMLQFKFNALYNTHVRIEDLRNAHYRCVILMYFFFF